MSAVKLQLNSLCLRLVTLSGIILGLGHAAAAAFRVVVKEDSDVVLPCSLSTEENIEFDLFDWKKAAQRDGRQKEVFMYDAGIHYNNGRDGQSEQFKGRVSHFPEELKHGNASITIRNTKVTDSGNYTCDVPRLQPPQTFQIELFVAPEPYINILEVSYDGALLQCVVRGAFPEPAVEWRDGAGNKLPAKEPQVSERGGSYDITLNATVTKSDNYQCVVTQETLSHQTEAQTFVYIRDSCTKALFLCFFGGLALGAVTVFAVLKPPMFIKRRCIKAAGRHEENVSGDPDADKPLNNGAGGVKVVVPEGEDVVLPCSLSTKENIEFKLFDWKKAAQRGERQKEVFMYDAGIHYNNGRDGQSEQFKGRVSHFPEELKHGNASITIRNTKVTDSGNYTCDFPRLQPRQTFHIQLIVGPRDKQNVSGDPDADKPLNADAHV